MYLKSILKAKHITQKELAEKLAVSQATISNIINGVSEPSEEQSRAIASMLAVPVEEITASADEWKTWPDNFACPRCNSRAVAEFINHTDGSCRLSCGFCGLDTGEQRDRTHAMRLFASYRPVSQSRAEHVAVHVLSVAELLDSSAYDADDVRPVWFENRGLFCCPALLQCGGAERERACVRVEWHNSFGLRSFDMRTYNSSWRCWTSKPTTAQMDSIAWNAPD